MNVNPCFSLGGFRPVPFRGASYLRASSLRFGDKFMMWTPFGLANFVFLFRKSPANHNCKTGVTAALLLPSRRVHFIEDLDIFTLCRLEEKA